MTEAVDHDALIAFGPYVLDRAESRLLRDGGELALPPRPFALLSHLVAHAGRLVSKDDLLDAVWGHRHVSESALKGCVNKLRGVLGDTADAPLWLETVPRRGYRFIGAVQRRAPDVPAPASPGPIATPGNLPGVTEPLIGRDAELAAVMASLDRGRLVTLLGSGGAGKTRLALAVAAQRGSQHADGVWLVRLDALADGLALVATVARILQLPIEAARSVDSVAAALSQLSLLLVLDNCEHLIDTVAPFVQGLLARAPRLVVLATSQQPLNLHDEQWIRLAPLPCPPPGQTADAESYAAVALFLRRVRSRAPHFVLDAAALSAVCALCAELDGLPLALELAAARVDLLGVEGVRALLQDRLALLTQGPRDAAPRHRSLRATLAWSHALLTDEQRTVLRRLAVFGGSFSLEAAQAVAGDESLTPWAVLDALGALLDRSLLVAETARTADPPDGARRLRLFDSIRSFAAEQLDAAGETRAMQARQARWMLALLDAAAADVHDRPLLEWTAPLQPEVDNLRLALGFAQETDPLLALALFSKAVVFWHRAGLKHEALRWLAAVRPSFGPDVPPPLRASFLQAQGFLCVYAVVGAPAEVAGLLQEAQRLHEEAGDGLNVYFDLFLQSHVMLRLQPELDPIGTWQAMVALEQPDWSPLRRRYSRAVAGNRLRDTGDSVGFRRFCVSEIALLRSAGDRSGVWTWTYGLALAEHDSGHAAQAIELLQSTVDAIRREHLLHAQPNVLAMLACMRLQQAGDIDAEAGALALAMPTVREAVALLRANGSLWWMAGALAFAALARGDLEAAARVTGWADAQVARRGETGGLFFGRLRATCQQRLQQALTADRLRQQLAEGALFDDDTALALALEPEVDG